MSQFTVRPASVADARPMAELFAAVAEERSGIVEEGRRVKHYRRANGELWDSLVMGLPLADSSDYPVRPLNS